MRPGEVITGAEPVAVNVGRPVLHRCSSTTPAIARSRSDRTIHFAEANPALAFDRAAARGTASTSRPARGALRAGRDATVDLVPFTGARIAPGFRGEVPGPLDRVRSIAPLRGPLRPDRGDRVRLGDTDLLVEVERDLAVGGDECMFGGGKVLRDRWARRCATAGRGPLDS